MPEGNGGRLRLKDRVAVVTGGAQGIGRAFCLGLADEGAKIVAADINLTAAEATCQEIEARGGEAMPLKTDVSVLEDTLEMARKTVERFGKVDILINNAAMTSRGKIIKMHRADFYDLDLDEWDKVMAVNLKGPLMCTRAVFPYMKKQGWGRIINLASGTFFEGIGSIAHYVASKGGVIGLTRSLATSLGQYNININCIAPGRTMCEDPDDRAALEECEGRIAFRCVKRVEYPEDLVGAAIFFASPDSDFITGQTLLVDGGETKH
jgi:3-oxoacyl-[acyl-carrier protein] reductase